MTEQQIVALVDLRDALNECVKYAAIVFGSDSPEVKAYEERLKLAGIQLERALKQSQPQQ